MVFNEWNTLSMVDGCCYEVVLLVYTILSYLPSSQYVFVNMKSNLLLVK